MYKLQIVEEMLYHISDIGCIKAIKHHDLIKNKAKAIQNRWINESLTTQHALAAKDTDETHFTTLTNDTDIWRRNTYTAHLQHILIHINTYYTHIVLYPYIQKKILKYKV